jgi:hypothetical protein
MFFTVCPFHWKFAAFGAGGAARAAELAAFDSYLCAYTRKIVLSASLKLHLHLMHVRKKLHELLLQKLQSRVQDRIAEHGGLNYVDVDLTARKVRILKPVQFEPGTAIVKKNSRKIMNELVRILLCAGYFSVP